MARVWDEISGRSKYKLRQTPESPDYNWLNCESSHISPVRLKAREREDDTWGVRRHGENSVLNLLIASFSALLFLYLHYDCCWDKQTVTTDLGSNTRVLLGAWMTGQILLLIKKKTSNIQYDFPCLPLHINNCSLFYAYIKDAYVIQNIKIRRNNYYINNKACYRKVNLMPSLVNHDNGLRWNQIRQLLKRSTGGGVSFLGCYEK